MATLANKENQSIFRVPPPKTPGNKSVMFKTPSRRIQDENSFNGFHTGKKTLEGSRVPGTVKTNQQQLPFTPVGTGRVILGGKTNVYKTPGLSNTKGKQFTNNNGYKEDPVLKQPNITTQVVEQTIPKSPQIDKYDAEVEFIPEPATPLPFIPLDCIEMDYEQLGQACQGRGQFINSDDSLDRPLSELMDQLPSIDHLDNLDNLDFMNTSPLKIPVSPKVKKPLNTRTGHAKSRRLSARTASLRKKDNKFSQKRQPTKPDESKRQPLQSTGTIRSINTRKGGFMAPTISAAAKSKNSISSFQSSEFFSPPRRPALHVVPQSPFSDYDYENQADLPSLEEDIEELEKALFI